MISTLQSNLSLLWTKISDERIMKNLIEIICCFCQCYLNKNVILRIASETFKLFFPFRIILICFQRCIIRFSEFYKIENFTFLVNRNWGKNAVVVQWQKWSFVVTRGTKFIKKPLQLKRERKRKAKEVLFFLINFRWQDFRTVCTCVGVCVWVYVGMCVREREKEIVCVCVCVWARVCAPMGPFVVCVK